MRFFKKKDKRKKDSSGNNGLGYSGGGGGGGSPGNLPGFGSNDYFDPQRKKYSGNNYYRGGVAPLMTPPTRRSAMLLSRFEASVLDRIFGYVCPQSLDESYETCERSALEDTCMLCDLRDLASCVLVSRRWREVAIRRLYYSIRIDTVHYCEREIYLSEERKKRGSFFDRNGEPEDPAQARLKLLCRTLREDPVRLGKLVRFFKTPYMLRESSQADLARTIAVTPNLRYVDLPEGLFTDEPSFLTLRLEVQARCHDLRKMTYMRGSENSLQQLVSGTIWTNLEVLDLKRINMDPAILRQVLGSLPNLRALQLSNIECINDEALGWHEMLPPFPPLEELILTNTPYITGEGLLAWLQAPEAQKSLKVLTLNETGVKVWTLHEILPYATSLKHLSIIESVSVAIQAATGSHYIPAFSCPSLETLHYEITASAKAPQFSGVTASYYNHLANSLLSGGLPNLHALYVRDPNFPELLLGLPPPAPAFAGGVPRPSSAGSMSGFGGGGARLSMSGGLLSSGGFSSPKLPPAQMGFPSPMGSPPTGGFSHQQQQSQHLNPFLTGNSGGHRSQGSISSLYSSPQHSGNGSHHLASNNPFLTAGAPGGGGPTASIVNLPPRLEVFTKGEDALDWSFVQVHAMTRAAGGNRRGGENGRPLSSYGLGADVMGGSVGGWSSGAGARKSILVGGAGGGFLAVPTDEGGARGRSGLGMGAGAGARGRSPGSLGAGVGFSSSYGATDGGNETGEDLWPRPRPLSSAGEKNRDLWR